MQATTENGRPATGWYRGFTEAGWASWVWVLARLSLGWVFMWAFLDKTFGLGRATESAEAWIDGGSPTFGFLKFGATGPFKGFYSDIAGDGWANWLFMIGLLAIGVALLLGIGMRVAAVAAVVMLVLMWTVVLPPENNPFMDDHLIYAILVVGLAAVEAGDTFGFGKAWGRLPMVQRNPWLK